MRNELKTGLVCLLTFAFFVACCPAPTALGEGLKAVDAYAFEGGLLVLMEDGTVRTVQHDGIESEYGYGYPIQALEESVRNWNDIIQLRKCDFIIAGLRADGTVVAFTPEPADSDNRKQYEEYVREIEQWDHIMELYGHYLQIAGLRDDGTIVTVGEDESLLFVENGPGVFETMKSWQNVRKLDIGSCFDGTYAVALHNDGTMSCTDLLDMGWSGKAEQLVDFDCSGWGLIALRADCTCVVNGEDSVYYRPKTNGWTDLKQVGCGDTLAIGLKNDGTFVTTRDDLSDEFSSLKNIDRFDCDTSSTICVYKTDGTAEVFFTTADTGNEEVRSWTDIEKILITKPVIVGLKTDGTLISTIGDINLN